MNEICERLREEALEGQASEELREHAATCPGCSEFLSRLDALSSDLAGLPPRDASDELVAHLLATPVLKSQPRMSWRFLAGVAAACLAIALALPLQRRASNFSMERSRAAWPASTPKEEVAAPITQEQRRDLQSLGYVGGERDKLTANVESADEFREQEELKKDAPGISGGVGGGVVGELGKRAEPGILLDEDTKPARKRQVEPAYPQAARDARVQGTVVLELTVDREGNVTDVRVVESIPLLDQAAIDAVREWKYEPSDSEAPRLFRVPVPFTLEEPQKNDDRSQVEGIPFQEAKGYWVNTYLPGDPVTRALEMRLRNASYPKPHDFAHPAALPLDPTSTGALTVSVTADRRGLTEKSRLLVQVGIRAAESHARRRPPMNVGIVLDLPESVSPEMASAAKALLESLESSQESGDRFRLIVPGSGEVLAPETFRRGALTVALQDLDSTSREASLVEALALALENVHAGDDPTMPLGTSLVLLVSGRDPGSELETLTRMAQTSALGGVSVSVVELAPSRNLDRIALDGQGRQYRLERASEAASVVDRELTSSSRTVARALRLRIHLAEGIHLVDVLGSERLNARQSERVRAEERAVDLRLARNLGIEADRGKDEDGIQIVIPAFYAGDAHSILLDVVADGPGPIAEATARYKDLIRLENTVARASLALARTDASAGPLETSVEDDYREHRVAEALHRASEAVARGATGTASMTLQEAATIAPERDRAMLEAYLRCLPQLPADYLRDSLLYASALKRRHSAS
jgi:TonB family protein